MLVVGASVDIGNGSRRFLVLGEMQSRLASIWIPLSHSLSLSPVFILPFRLLELLELPIEAPEFLPSLFEYFRILSKPS